MAKKKTNVEEVELLHKAIDLVKLTGINIEERQQVNEQKAIFKDRLLNADDIANAVKLLVRCYRDYAEVIANNNVIDAKSLLNTRGVSKDGDVVNIYDPESDTYKELEKQTHLNYWLEVSEENKVYFEEILNTVDFKKAVTEKDYIKLVDFVINSTETTLEWQEKNKKEINHLKRKYKEVLNRIDPAFIVFMHLYLAETKENHGYVMQTSFITVIAKTLRRAPSRIELDAILTRQEYKNLKGKHFIYAYALAEIVGNFALIGKGVEDDEPAEEEENSLIPRMFYDTEMQISHSRYITALVENGFKLNESVFNESEDTLNNLESEDNDILDLLILNWYAHGVRRFTDRQIAVSLYHGGNTNADVNKKELQKINESIERLRRTEIKQGVESSEDIGNTKLKYTQRPFLISVLPQDIEHEGDTTVYDFTGVQGYEEYALITNRTSKYKNALITADIKGIQHDFKNDTLKRLLMRRITGLQFNKHTAIDMREVYEVLEITDPRNYTYAKKKVKTMLDELKNEENDTYYNFGYEFKKRNKATILTFTRSTKAPLEGNKTAKG